ncbi:MAG: solute carrier family 23 protein [Candidatus Omnitrophota bacterium]
MLEKPSNLIYGLDDKPPLLVTIILGFQHIFTMSSTLMLPVIIVHEIGGSFLQTQSLVCFSMIAIGIGTVLQCLKRGPVGSGYLCPHLSSPSYLPVSIHAAWLGGLPLMHGMIMVSGVFEAVFSRIIHKLKRLFPTEVSGLVVLMVGVALIPIGASKFMGIDFPGDPLMPRHLLVASLTLVTMIGVNIWSRGKLRLYCVIIGLAVGYLLSFFCGVFSTTDWEHILKAPFFAIPGIGIEKFKWSFSWSLLLPFIIVTLCGSLKSVGNITTCQKINDDKFKEPDMQNIGKGLLAEAIGIFSAGLLGGTATDTSSSNIGLSAATGATSRIIGICAGIIYISLAFLPKLTAFVSVMPSPVMGAILIFVTSFVVIAGLQIILTRPLTVRMAFVVGVSFIFGTSLEILPGLYNHVHPWLRPLLSSSLTFATFLAIALNQIFNLGEKFILKNHA